MPESDPKPAPDPRRKWRDAPHKPGVYLMRDRFGTVIYVGKARDLRRRLAHYFQPSRQTLANAKTRALIHSIHDLETHVVRHETEALLLEMKWIKEFRPRYNVSFRDDKRFLMVRAHLDDPCPKLQLTRLKKDDGARYLGPYAHSAALRETIDWLNRKFGLRTCRPRNPGEKDHKHCHADRIKNCSAPCIGRISPEEYRERVAEAMRILETGDRATLKAMERDMEEAAATLDFEKAARLRDALAAIRKTVKRTRRFTRGRGEPAPANPLDDVLDLQQALGLATAPLVMECFDISNISNTYSVASMVRFTNGVPDSAAYRRYRIKGVDGQNDFASMAEVVRRRYRHMLAALRKAGRHDPESQETPADAAQRIAAQASSEQTPTREARDARIPDLIVVDGGKGQLSSAVAELQALGLWDIPVIGLAKQREEIFRPGSEFPLVLPHDRAALKLLQRIRDEAHRFANGYHQVLLRRRIRESLLDDAPGMTPRRKEILLREFGSVARLRRADASEIAALQGISRAFADALLQWLRRDAPSAGNPAQTE